MLRVLILEWDSFGQEYIKEEFKKVGIEVSEYVWPFGQEDMRDNPRLLASLRKSLLEGNYVFVFSLNYFPVAAKACFSSGVKYVSWVYDSPYMLLYSATVNLCNNYIFIFDKSLFQEFQEHGVKTVYYLPLAAPVAYYDSLNGLDIQRFKAFITFVGSTYEEDRQNLMKRIEGLGNRAKGYLEGIIMMQHQIQEGFLLEELLQGEILQELEKACPLQLESDEWESKAWIYANYFLARRVTGVDRICALRALSEQMPVVLYTPDETPRLEKVINRGSVDYHNEMPLIFKATDINLNITLRSIHTGIPLRAMDIMGCGGFLLTDYQEDFQEFFIPGEDYVYFTDEEDLCLKAAYYMEHEDERRRIARNGYEKVKKNHTYAHRIKKILHTVLGNWEKEVLEEYDIIKNIRKKYEGGVWYNFVGDVNMEEDELITLSDEAFFKMDLEREHWFNIKTAVLQEINRLLQEKCADSWDKIDFIMYRYLCIEMCSFFPEFDYINTFLEAYRRANKDGRGYSFFRFDSVEELVATYRRVCNYLRRLEHNFDKKEQEEGVEYMLQQKLPLDLLIQILHDNRYIKDKDRVLNILRDCIKRWPEKEINGVY